MSQPVRAQCGRGLVKARKVNLLSRGEAKAGTVGGPSHRLTLTQGWRRECGLSRDVTKWWVKARRVPKSPGALAAIPRAWGLSGCGSGGRKLAVTLEAGQGVLFQCAEFEAFERQQVGSEKHNPGSQKGGLAGDRGSWVEKSGCCQQGPRWDLGRPREWPGWGGGGG